MTTYTKHYCIDCKISRFDARLHHIPGRIHPYYLCVPCAKKRGDVELVYKRRGKPVQP